MRRFSGLLYWGRGNTSIKELNMLVKILNEAAIISSGLQQGISINSEEYKICELEIEDIIRDISAALLGKEISFGKELPYPPLHEVKFGVIND